MNDKDELDTFEFLDEVQKELLILSEAFRFDKNHIFHFHIVALYGSLLELISVVVFSSKCETKIGIPIITRSVLEASLDLLNLCSDPKYGYRLEVDFVRNWLDFLGEAKRGENIYLKKLGEHNQIGDSIKGYKKRAKELSKDGHKRIEIKEKFKLANMQSEYTSIYSSLCAYSHNNLRALRDRHATVQDGDFSLTFFKEESKVDYDHYAGTCCELLMRCSEVIHQTLNTSVKEQISAVREKVDEYKKMLETKYA